MRTAAAQRVTEFGEIAAVAAMLTILVQLCWDLAPLFTPQSSAASNRARGDARMARCATLRTPGTCPAPALNAAVRWLGGADREVEIEPAHGCDSSRLTQPVGREYSVSRPYIFQ